MTLFFQRGRLNPFANFTGILMMILLMVGLFYVAKGVYWLLAKAAVVLLVATLLVHYPTIVRFLRWLGGTWQRNPLQGLLYTALGALLYPVLIAGLFFQALLNRKVSRLEQALRQEQEGEFVDFEELETQTHRQGDRRQKLESVQEDRYKDLFE